MTTSLTIQESPADLEFLSKNNYNLQVAKAVSAPGGKPTFNVVYKSKSLAPNMTVSWSPTYGLNWATEVADPGAQVVYAGNWQACELGQSYDLTSVGEWVINNKDPNKDANSVNVGNNGYPQAVNIVVGILNPETQSWEAIFVSQDQLPPQGFGEYQPRDVVQLWYEEGILTETMMSKQSTTVETFDMTKIPLEFFWYSTATGAWENSSTPFTLTPSS
ncbi:hypothetical protein MGU_08450 [Metarhizium guizhouense ARSEF 977]|uniref:Uncharacterized protein n=1 Tax=Metarhizium guizhouense (strain ARSEF 977) TaxID=1276136 RepID=A0A0B4HXK7_METGA|nr:hypothetical protein MGU_08450 [Metarhizium guizhouense ARSEF 977]